MTAATAALARNIAAIMDGTAAGAIATRVVVIKQRRHRWD